MDETTRRWEDLDMDCLSNVFSRVGMETLVLAVPFVCKPWYATSLNSCLCWKSLSFPDFKPYPLFIYPSDTDESELHSFGPFYDKFVQVYGIDTTRFSITGFIKWIVNRSKGEALELKLPQFCTAEACRYVADACPLVRVLSFPDNLMFFKHSRVIGEVIGKLKFLEHLTLGGNLQEIGTKFLKRRSLGLQRRILGEMKFSKHFEVAKPSLPPSKVLNEILGQIGRNCKHIRTLHIFDAIFSEVVALTIVTLLPNLEELILPNCFITQHWVAVLLQGCKKLSCFHVLHNNDFEEVDQEELRRLASHITEFCCEKTDAELQFIAFFLTVVAASIV